MINSGHASFDRENCDPWVGVEMIHSSIPEVYMGLSWIQQGCYSGVECLILYADLPFVCCAIFKIVTFSRFSGWKQLYLVVHS